MLNDKTIVHGGRVHTDYRNIAKMLITNNFDSG